MQSILGNTRKADITFHAGGRINISARVSKSLGLAHGDVIDIMEHDEEIYLYIKHKAPVVGRHEGMVFCSKKNGHHCVASSRRLCQYVMRHHQSKDKLRLCCGTPTKLPHYGTALPIIINNILSI